MNNEEYIDKYGKSAFLKRQKCKKRWRKEHREEIVTQSRKWARNHPDLVAKIQRNWCQKHPDHVLVGHREGCRKGGKYYLRKLVYNHTGLQGARSRIRTKHAIIYRPYKNIIAPGSQIHHEWIPGTTNYRGVAIVEANQHMHGIIDVIKILKGEITLFSEKEIRNG